MQTECSSDPELLRCFGNAELQFREPRIEPAARDQGLMRALFDDTTSVHDKDAVRPEDR